MGLREEEEEVDGAVRDLGVVGEPLQLDVAEHLGPHPVAVAHLAHHTSAISK